MDRLTRKELKTDKFALEVQHSVEYFSQHRQFVTRWGGLALALVVVVGAVYFYRSYQHSVRQADLHSAMLIANAVVGPSQSEYVTTFPTAADRYKAVDKAFGDIERKYSGSDEAAIAEFFLGTNAADQGKMDEAEKHFKTAVDSGRTPYVSVAKLSLAQIYASKGKLADGEKLIQSVIDHPTILVSKDEATIALGELLAPTDPQRARKLLEPLRNSPRSSISKVALSVLGDIGQK